MSSIPAGTERILHVLYHLALLSGQIGRLLIRSPIPVIAGDSFDMVAFFYLYRHHRDLHSFPTRRSSDLGVLLQVGGCEVDDDAIDGAAVPRVDQGALDAVGALADGGLGEPDEDGLGHGGGGDVDLDLDRDRKSTRLNSSHANISYAVFCL